MEDNIAVLLAQVARLMRRNFDERARAIGVTRPQWQVISTLARNEGINQGALADLLEVEPITTARMIDRLQEAGLVERRPDPADRRAWLLFLTERSRGLTAKLRPLGEEALAQALEGVAENERQQLGHTLLRIRNNLSRKPSSPEVPHG